MEIEISDDDDLFQSLKKKKEKKKVTKKKTKLHQKTKQNFSKEQNKKTIEETYVRKDPIEHILIRPDTYIGTIEKTTEEIWVVDEDKGLNFREITYVPGLYKIFDEILVNAADNKQRDPNMTMIKVDIDQEKNKISIWNDGKGIPVEVSPKEKILIPELIFGHLLTGSNFDDSKKKTTGGRNGYGAKLCNIFSKEFIVETNDTLIGKKFYQKFTNNMKVKTKPKLTKGLKKDFTKITFEPDLTKFRMKELDKDIIALCTKRVYDIAGTTGGIKVKLNGKELKIHNFQQYCKLYIPQLISDINEKFAEIYERPDKNWEIMVVPSDGQFQQISFVNSICTSKGGSHIKYATKQITNYLYKILQTKEKNSKIQKTKIKNQFIIFVNCLIENPSFDTQTKENLKTPQKKFGSKFQFSQAFLKRIKNSTIFDNILIWRNFQKKKQLKKKSGSKKKKLLGILKLDDANLAGSRYGKECTLILTEGDSAKSLVVSGLGVIGRDYYGVFPIKGKLLNVREATHNQIMKNKEIESIIKILGLKHGQKYSKENIKSLRYGHLMIMTDQDLDGSHIKGLIINLIHHFWPSLLKLDGFLQEFVTPIVKVTKKGKKNQNISFYTLQEFTKWKQKVNNDGKGWKIKYYKGLGTSTSKEAKEYFNNLERHVINFKYENEKDDQSIELAFSKKKMKERKEWLKNVDQNLYIDHVKKQLVYSDFINKELIFFSNYDNVRSIGSMIDGLKPVQRKVLYCCFKKNLTKREIKVAQLVGYVSEQSAYHHGEQSLAGTIIGMAQDFVGSNNINLLLPNGQFGTRLQGGKDSASGRYIYTLLNSITRTIYHPDDDQLLNYLKDDGKFIEPEFYVPILPMILINGCEGIGTGYSTKIPNYNPIEIVANIKRKLYGQEFLPMDPWYNGFIGEIKKIKSIKNNSLKYDVLGKWEMINNNTLQITELTITSKHFWIHKYKKFLESIRASNPNAKQKLINDYKEFHTEKKVHFEIEMDNEQVLNVEKIGIEKAFKLKTSLTLNNMMAFDHNGKLQYYKSANQILNNFFIIRLEYYHRRKEYLLKEMKSKIRKFENKTRFIKMIISQELIIANKKKNQIEEELLNLGFIPILTNKKKKRINGKVKNSGDGKKSTKYENFVKSSGFNYLLKIKLSALNQKKYQQILNQLQKIREKRLALKDTPVEVLWDNDLNDFLTTLYTFNNYQNMINEEIMEKKGKKKITYSSRNDSFENFNRINNQKLEKNTIGKKTGNKGVKSSIINSTEGSDNGEGKVVKRKKKKINLNKVEKNIKSFSRKRKLIEKTHLDTTLKQPQINENFIKKKVKKNDNVQKKSKNNQTQKNKRGNKWKLLQMKMITNKKKNQKKKNQKSLFDVFEFNDDPINPIFPSSKKF
ncbi:DNA topoisomerase/gyrase [Anaeramoeba flamelloides]|uniref:DNA topoisomerase 2 n=1 Tax=Anaeramoeba flamelloides TaxID=1746091 RepID=A0AAV8AHS9_9EUKA|nr:DNA topoisomerase/gyrase [Anaeramoeba flamelloides]